MITNRSARFQCGALLPNLLIRHFCRQARCKTCVRHACRRRSQIFARRCELSSDFDASVSFIAPLDAAFADWRRKIHDAVDHRRGVDRRWASFALIARFDGCAVRGMARLASLGQLDLQELIGPAEIMSVENLDAQTVARTLAAGSFGSLPGSVKNIFLTINPCRGAYARTAAQIHDEPMPIIF